MCATFPANPVLLHFITVTFTTEHSSRNRSTPTALLSCRLLSVASQHICTLFAKTPNCALPLTYKTKFQTHTHLLARFHTHCQMEPKTILNEIMQQSVQNSTCFNLLLVVVLVCCRSQQTCDLCGLGVGFLITVKRSMLRILHAVSDLHARTHARKRT